MGFKQPKVAIMGVTFKENCPDIRNSKVFNIVKTLESHNFAVDLIVPIADPKNVCCETNYQLTDKLCQKYVGIIIAVKHDEFKRLTADYLKEKMVKGGLIFDLKSLYDKSLSDFRL